MSECIKSETSPIVEEENTSPGDLRGIKKEDSVELDIYSIPDRREWITTGGKVWIDSKEVHSYDGEGYTIEDADGRLENALDAAEGKGGSLLIDSDHQLHGLLFPLSVTDDGTLNFDVPASLCREEIGRVGGRRSDFRDAISDVTGDSLKCKDRTRNHPPEVTSTLQMISPSWSELSEMTKGTRARRRRKTCADHPDCLDRFDPKVETAGNNFTPLLPKKLSVGGRVYTVTVAPRIRHLYPQWPDIRWRDEVDGLDLSREDRGNGMVPLKFVDPEGTLEKLHALSSMLQKGKSETTVSLSPPGTDGTWTAQYSTEALSKLVSDCATQPGGYQVGILLPREFPPEGTVSTELIRADTRIYRRTLT